MAPHELATLEARLSALDQATALRVARLVLECGSSLPMALLAVQDADRSVLTRETERSHSPRQRSRRWLFIAY
jgi:hypothetical protein